MSFALLDYQEFNSIIIKNPNNQIDTSGAKIRPWIQSKVEKSPKIGL